jgi:hypothetical protein
MKDALTHVHLSDGGTEGAGVDGDAGLRRTGAIEPPTECCLAVMMGRLVTRADFSIDWAFPDGYEQRVMVSRLRDGQVTWRSAPN